MVQQARVLWAAAGGAGGETALHFEDSVSPGDIVTSIQAFLTAVRTVLANTTSASCDPIIRQLATSSGTLTGEVALGGTPNITGNGGTNAVPNAAQGLIRFRTSAVINGRFLTGRLYVPGMSSSTAAASGEVTSTAVTTLASAGTALTTGAGGLVIWHRPVGGAGGSASLATSATAWSEFATQRRRRS